MFPILIVTPAHMPLHMQLMMQVRKLALIAYLREHFTSKFEFKLLLLCKIVSK